MGLRTLSRLGAGLILAGALPLAVGCQTTKKVSHDLHETLFVSAPQPASNLGCMWKKQIAHLPDPTRDGVMAPGIVGVVNLYAADGLPTKAEGDLQIMAYDETPRPAGQPVGVPQMWHFDPQTLKQKLATTDDRGMDCYAVFLPWPANWTDVTKVSLQAKYTPKAGGPTLTASDPAMMFEFAAFSGAAGGGSPGDLAKGPSEMRGIPDLKTMLQQPTAGREPVVVAKSLTAPGVQPAVVPVAAQQTAVAPQAPTMAVQLPKDAPIVIPVDAAPMPSPVPPPPPAMPRGVVVTPVAPVAAAKADTVSVQVGEGLPSLDIPAAR